jgi:hypothetical protein
LPFPLGLVDLLKAALRLYRACPRPFLVISAIVAIPAGALDIATTLSSSRPQGDTGRTATQLLIQFVPALLLSTIGAVAATIAVMDHLAGSRPSLSRCFEPVGERFWPLVGTLAVIAVAVVGSVVAAVTLLPMALVLALVVLTVYLFVMWLFAPQAAVIERRGVRAALARSRELVAGAWLSVFAVFVVIQAITLLAEVALTSVARPAEALSNNGEVILIGSWNVIVMIVVEPFALIALGLLYLDRRVRRDGGWQAVPERESAEPPI